MTADAGTIELGTRLEAIDRYLDGVLKTAGTVQASAGLRELACRQWAAAASPLEKAAWRTCLLRASLRVEDAGERGELGRLAAELARLDVASGKPLASCSNEDMANLHASIAPANRAASILAILRTALDHNLDLDANALLGPLDAQVLTQVLDMLGQYAEETQDAFKRFRASMILFGLFHKDADEDGGTRYVRTALAPDPARAKAAYERAQAAYIEGISLKLNTAVREKGLHFAKGLEDYNLRIPDVFRKHTLTVRTGVRIELDSCVGNDHVLVSQEIGAQIIHVSIRLRDVESGRYDYPIAIHVRRIEEPVFRLQSIDKQAGPVEVSTVGELFDLAARGANEWVRLSKASIISSGIIPYACRTLDPATPLRDYLVKLGGGLEVVTHLKGIPVGSGMGTSSAFAAAIVAALVKITGQTASAPDAISDEEKMMVVARVLLVEQLIGALGGWQDPCAIFPGIKLLETRPGDFLPVWRLLNVPASARAELIRRLKLTDGAYRQPSHAAAWQFTGLWAMRLAPVYEARMSSRQIVRQQIQNLESGQIAAMGPLETADWENRRKISPKATNPYIEDVIRRMRSVPGCESIGFDACGARGGAGGCWWINPAEMTDARFHDIFREQSLKAMEQHRNRIRFEGEPHVYDYEINDQGVVLELG